MVSEVLVQKIRERIKSGLNEITIKNEMLADGWSLDDFLEVWSKETGVEKKETKKNNAGWLVPLVFVVLGIGVSVVLAFGVKMVWDKKMQQQLSEKESISNISPTATPSPADQGVEIKLPEIVVGATFTDKKNGFSIVPPAGWTVDETGVTGNLVYFEGPIATVSGKAIRANMGVMVGPSNDASIENYSAFYQKETLKSLPTFEIVDQKIIGVNGLKVYSLRGRYYLEDIAITNRVEIAIVGAKVYIVTAQMPETEWEKVGNIVDESFATFRVF